MNIVKLKRMQTAQLRKNLPLAEQKQHSAMSQRSSRSGISERPASRNKSNSENSQAEPRKLLLT